ncbi:MAG: hypothetical protein LBC41_02095, partial [Clostridiales bacterium]|nr:hypothetical protein [Clostridiales bacterium]
LELQTPFSAGAASSTKLTDLSVDTNAQEKLKCTISECPKTPKAAPKSHLKINFGNCAKRNFGAWMDIKAALKIKNAYLARERSQA